MIETTTSSSKKREPIQIFINECRVTELTTFHLPVTLRNITFEMKLIKEWGDMFSTDYNRLYVNKPSVI